MTDITAQMVKELRVVSGAGMMDCKNALAATQGNIEAAIDWLRTKGLAKAANKAGRVTAEGAIVLAQAGTQGVLVEVNSETDFVARNAQFQSMVARIAAHALTEATTTEQLLESNFTNTDKSIKEYVQEMVGTIGENMNIRRMAKLEVAQGVIGTYVHNQFADNMGKIGVLVALDSPQCSEDLSELAKKLAMHVAAAHPIALDKNSLSPENIARERKLFMEEAKMSGKPPEIAEKIVEGRLRKYFEEVLLTSQIFVMDGETRISQVIADAADRLGAPIKLAGFVRYELGEGLDKGDMVDFATEVNAAIEGS